MRSLHGVSLALALLAGSNGFAQTTLPAAGLALYDVDGKRVGPALGDSPLLPRIALRIDGLAIVIAMGSDRFVGTQRISGAPYFESMDCSGTPLLPVNPTDPPELAPITYVETETPGIGAATNDLLSVVYIPDPAVPPRLFRIRSEANREGPPRCRVLVEQPFTGVPARRLVDLATRFHRPLHLRAEPAVDLPGLARRVRALEAENAALRLQLSE